MIRGQTLYDFNTFRPWNFVPCFMPMDMFECLLVCNLWIEFASCVKIVLVLIMLNWFIVLLRSTFLSIQSIDFWEFDIEISTKNFYLLKKLIVIYNVTICNFVISKSPINVLSHFNNLKNLKKSRRKKALSLHLSISEIFWKNQLLPFIIFT